MFANRSIQRKQMLIIMLTSSAALLLACAAFVVYESISFRRNMTENLASLASIIGNNSTAALSFNDAETAREILNSLSKEQHIVAACIYDRDGQVFAKYARDPANEDFDPPQPLADGYEFNDKHLMLFQRVLLKGERAGTVYIQSDLEELSNRFRQYVGIVAVVLLASSLVAFLLSLRLQRVISTPILNLASTAKIVSAEKNYSVRAVKSSQDELGELIDGFNEMLAQIQARDAALQTAHDDLEKRVHERTGELEQEVADRRRAEVGLQQQITRISLLNAITRAIADRQDLESVVHVVLRKLEEQLPIDFGRVYLYDAQAETVAAAARRVKEQLKNSTTVLFASNIPIKQTGFQACLEGETIEIADTAAGDSPLHRRLADAHLRSAVAVPLIVEDELFGILLTARRHPNGFSNGECDFLKMLSEQVALAAHQARLHAQLQRAYDELRQTQQAVMQEERLRALGQMASGIAHDINNALCPIVVYADLLLQTERNLTEGAHKNLQNIKMAGEDIAHIVSRMREFYRHREEMDALVPVDLNRLINQVVELTRPRWRDIPQARGIMVELRTDFEDGVPKIVGNESELREALTNLILNAVDAMPAGGRLTLRSRSGGWKQSDSGERCASHVVLEVSDTGVGMDEETRKRCLEPFFSTKGKRGTGLGLAMVYGIMVRHEGVIEVETALGRGTTMRLVFPIREGRSSVASPQTLTPLPVLHVLCIDDEPLLREMLQQILDHGGHTVEIADGGPAGLALFRAARQRGEPFDVVITDLGMPYLDGRQLAKTMKRESPTTPIIMLTGWGTILKEDNDLPSQVDGVLSKPPKITELYEMLGKVTKHGTATPAR
jgi:signal transduction histidine kinase/uncharacterized membrane protein affecting hemolysin expression/ActR/RegA family two-component response regulator